MRFLSEFSETQAKKVQKKGGEKAGNGGQPILKSSAEGGTRREKRKGGWCASRSNPWLRLACDAVGREN